jgi:AAA15 family ATPase/GTPase
MITAFEIENFKAFKNRQRIPLKPITLIYGPNSAEKSSVIQALFLLEQMNQKEKHRCNKYRKRFIFYTLWRIQ